MPWRRQHGVAVVAYSPFGHGEFPKPASSGGRGLADIAAVHGTTARHVALAFLLRQPGVFIIPKTVCATHTEDNAGTGALVLGAAEIARIDAAPPVQSRARLFADDLISAGHAAPAGFYSTIHRCPSGPENSPHSTSKGVVRRLDDDGPRRGGLRHHGIDLSARADVVAKAEFAAAVRGQGQPLRVVRQTDARPQSQPQARLQVDEHHRAVLERRPRCPRWPSPVRRGKRAARPTDRARPR